MLIKEKEKILFVGDSVTESFRNYDARPGSLNSLGIGFPSLIYATLTSMYPEKDLMIINKGVSGDTILHMKKRWQTDVLDLNPDTLFILIGINDVWRFFDSPFMHLENLVDSNLFKKTYQELIEVTRQKGRKIILIEPFMFENNMDDPMRKKLSHYQEITKELAKKNDLPSINIQKVINRFLEKKSSYVLSSDRVHPNLAGHMLIANSLLENLNF